MKNVCIASNPLNIEIPGLPHVLEGHIVPALNVASLIGIQILCKVGCRIVFTDTACYVKYNGKIILKGKKDPSTDLWVLPLTPDAISTSQKQLWTSQGDDEEETQYTKLQSHAGPGMARAPQSPMPCTPDATVAMFPHSIRTRANTVKFGHQSMCNPTFRLDVSTTTTTLPPPVPRSTRPLRRNSTTLVKHNFLLSINIRHPHR